MFDQISNTTLLHTLFSQLFDGGFSDPDNYNETIKSRFEQQNISILTLRKKTFLNTSSKQRCTDEIFGTQSTNQCSKKAFILAEYLKKTPGKEIGILLPATSTIPILVIACYLAEKVPVFFNRTGSDESFEHCKKLVNCQTIISSKRFIENSNIGRLKKTKVLFLEEITQDIGYKQKILGMLRFLLKIIPNIKQEAVILFTSGSEGLPKAVTLTHMNIIQDIYGRLQLSQTKANDILLGFLPPFHSFGFTATVIMPLITGLRVVYHPNPTQSDRLISLIKHYQVTSITTSPTLLKLILTEGQNEDFNSISAVFVGGEYSPKSVIDLFYQKVPNGHYLQGYGLTECSPVISLNPITKPKSESLGKTISGLETVIIDPNSNLVLEKGNAGLLCVRGNSIFDRNLNKTESNDWITINHKEYFCTKDICYFDKDNYLRFIGREKRIIKRGGEMISLVSIEQKIDTLFKELHNGKQIALVINQDNTVGEQLILFSTREINIQQLHENLYKMGLPNLIRIHKHFVIPAIPLKGIGKIDYHELHNHIKRSTQNSLVLGDNSIERIILAKISQIRNLSEESLTPSMIVGEEIQLDSIDIGELMIFIKQNFPGVQPQPLYKIKTINDIIRMARGEIL